MICLKVSSTSQTYREETETKQWSVSKWAPPVRHIEKKHKLNNDLSQSELHQSDIQRRNRNQTMICLKVSPTSETYREET